MFIYYSLNADPTGMQLKVLILFTSIYLWNVQYFLFNRLSPHSLFPYTEYHCFKSYILWQYKCLAGFYLPPASV